MHAPEPTRWAEVFPRVAGAKRVAFDLEGDFNLYRYGRRICLFQIALEDGSVFLLDPLESDPRRWAGWQAWLEDPGVVKVIWAAQNDIRVLKACLGFRLAGLWDLFDAACLAVTPKPSLPLLASTFLGLSLEKSEALQTSDWNLRPLSEEQRAYAAQDVSHLLALADALSPLLDEKRKRAAFEARMANAEGYEFAEHAEPWRRLKGAAVLEADQQTVLASLWRKREEQARSLDVAPWRLVPHDELVRLARTGSFSEIALIDPRWRAD